MEIKILQTVAWNWSGDKRYARILIPQDVVVKSFLGTVNEEKIAASYTIREDGSVGIELRRE